MVPYLIEQLAQNNKQLAQNNKQLASENVQLAPENLVNVVIHKKWGWVVAEFEIREKNCVKCIDNKKFYFIFIYLFRLNSKLKNPT